MNRKCFTKVKPRWLYIQCLLLFAVQPGANTAFCPSTCVCNFDEILQDNTATCTFGDSTADLSSISMFGHLAFKLNCSNTIENYQYDCNELPQFNISDDDVSVMFQGCAPSIIRCAHKVFNPVTIITELNVKKMAGSFSADDLTGFNHLRRVRVFLRENDTELPAAVFNSLTSLEYFTITGGRLQLSPKEFNMPKLDYLCLEHNNIEHIPPDAFSRLPNLQFLEIQRNTFEHLDANAFKGLNLVEYLTIRYNKLQSIDPVALSSMKKLDTVYFTSNRLKLLLNGLFTGLDNLHKVSITNNKVEMILDTHAFANLRIDSVVVSTSKVKYLPEEVFKGSTNLHYLDLHSNKIETLPLKIFATNTGLVDLNLSRNKIQNLPDGIFSELKELEAMDLSYNHLSVLRGDLFIHNTKLNRIKLSNNRLTDIDRDIFKGTNLRSLNLASNKLQRINGDTPLEWQTNILDLSDNELTVFEDWFVELKDLVELNLSGNKIQMIKASQIYQLQGESIVNLSNNSITEIVPNTSVPPIKVKPGIRRIYLSNNPLKCDCTVMTLLKEWHSYDYLPDYEDITCGNGEKLSDLLKREEFQKCSQVI